MRRIFWLLFIFIGWAVPAVAADLDVTVRTDRMKVGENPLPILVTVKAATVAVENNLKITVGNGYTVNAVPSNVTVAASGLPSGVVSFPGIANALSVSGKLITFPSGDLVVGTTYGFYITGGIGVNPGFLNRWLVQTANGGTVIDQNEVGLNGAQNDQVVVTGKVGALASDFQLAIVADKTTDLNVGDEVTYTINYGSYLLNLTKPLKISAEWSRGTVFGSPTPSVDIADYVIGSSSLGYGGAVPVIDLLNRRIEWTISSFPANTLNQSVSFKLVVNNSYTGLSKVGFDVTAYLRGANVVTTNTSVNSVYKPIIPTATPTMAPTLVPSPTLIPSPTPTSVPGINPTSVPAVLTSTPQSTTPTPTVLPLKINSVGVAILSDSGIGINVVSNQKPALVKIKYGDSLGNLSKTITSVNGVLTDVVSLEALLPDKNYYFRVEVTSGAGKVVLSDIYTFKTAVLSDLPVIDPNSVVISVADNVILDASEEKDPVNSVIMTPSSNYAFRINLTKPEEIKSVKIFIRDSQVLGITTVLGAEPNSTTVDLSEIVNGGFVGHLVSPSRPGYYDIALRVEDVKGNIVESKVGELRIVEPVTVVNANGAAVENAKISFYKFNLKKQVFEEMAADFLGISNPGFTEPNGQLNVVLPKGRYRIEVSRVGYEGKTVDFVLGLGAEEKLPKVSLVKSSPTLSIAAGYYGGVITDVYGFTVKFVSGLIFSSRFFDVTVVMVWLALVIVLWSLATTRLKVWWWMLPWKLARMLKRENLHGKVAGTLVDEQTLMPVNRAKVYLLDGKNNKVLSEIETDILGEFCLDLKAAKVYKLMATKDGYNSTPMLDYSLEGLTAGKVVIKMENDVSNVEIVENVVWKMLNRGSGFLMTLWLLLLLILTVGFSIHFGMLMAGLPMVLSWLNLALWLSKK